jgi:RNA polymerase sigma-70 factor (ECF subfamily)
MAIDLNPEELILFQRKDEKTLTRVILAFDKEMLLYNYKIVKNKADAEDIWSEVKIRLWQYTDRLNSVSHINNFLYYAARNLSLNWVRDHKKYLSLPIDDPDAWQKMLDQQLPDEEEVFQAKVAAGFWDKRVVPALMNLPGDYGKAMRYRYLEDKSTAEIAELMGLSPGKVDDLLSYGRKKIVRHFKKKPHEPITASSFIWILFNII